VHLFIFIFLFNFVQKGLQPQAPKAEEIHSISIFWLLYGHFLSSPYNTRTRNPASGQPTKYAQNVPIVVYTMSPDDEQISAGNM
jgi:hypothetical protein